jgi:peptidyl-prolyl cis-trans isomerase B (cyclophilin B)
MTFPPPPPDAVPPEVMPYPEYPGFPPYPGYPPYPYPVYPPYPGAPARRTNAMAVASLVCAFLFAPLGILFGHLSLSQIKRSGEEGRGVAVAGLVLSYLFTIGLIVTIVLAVMLVSFAQRIANEEHYRGRALGLGPTTPIVTDGTLPPFQPPAGLGSACAYPPTATAPATVAKLPRGGAVPTTPAEIPVTMTTSAGAVGLDLNNATSPCTVNSFVSLAQQGYFDDTPCHRLTDAPELAVLQCGDPSGDGSGGPGYRFANEYPTNQYRPFDPALRQPLTYPRGTLAMANSGPDSNGSQFFIVYRDSQLPPTYTVFGSVGEAGMVVVDRLVSVGVEGGADDGKPQRPITIESIRLN